MILALVIMVVALQLVDGWSTWQVLRFNKGRESNPVMSYLIERFGLYSALLIGKGAASGLIVVAYSFGLLDSVIVAAVTFLLAAFYVVVIVNNLTILYDR